MIDIRALLRDLGITFYERRKNIMRNCVGISCFKCSLPDPSWHLNIALDGSFMHCFRCGFHKSGVKSVLEELLGKTILPKEFLRLCQRYKLYVSVDSVIDNENNSDVSSKSVLAQWEQFSALRKSDLMYLYKRGITEEFARLWGLKGGTGKYLCYVMIPVRDAYNGNLVGFVGRDITGRSSKRFLNSQNSGLRQHLFGLYECKERILRDKYVVIVEGVFDVLKGQQHGLNTIGLLGKRITTSQLITLVDNLTYDVKVFVLLDSDAQKDETLLVDQLRPYFNTVVGLHILDNSVKDIGDMTPQQILELKSFLEEYS